MTAPAGKSALARNTVYALLGHVVGLAVPIVMTPYIVGQVGMAHYGLWAALNALVLVLGQYDLGLWNAIAREVAIRRARDDREGLRSLLATCFVYDMAAAPVLFGLVWLAGRPILAAVLPGTEASFAFPILATLTLQAVLMPGARHAIQALYGLQRLDLVNLLSIIITPLTVGGMVLFLESGWGLLGLAANGVIFLALQVGILLVLLRAQNYPVSFSPLRYDSREHRALLGFGGKVEIGRLLLLLFRWDRLLLSASGIAPGRIASYQLGAALSDRLGGSVGVLSAGVLPAASDLAARGDLDRVRMLFMRATKYHALATVGTLGFAVLFGHELMVLWMGEAHPASVDVLRILAVGGACFAVVWPAHAIGVALGRAWLQTVSAASGLAFAALLYMTVGRRYDVEGLAWAASLGLALVQVVQMIGLRRSFSFDWREYVGNALLKPLVLAAPVALVFALRLLLAPHLPEIDGRFAALALVAPAFLMAVGLGWAAARAFRVIDAVDVDMLKSFGRRSPA